LLLVRIPELSVKPAHRRGKSIEESWIRSGGSTRKASRQEIGALLMNSSNPRWEELRASPLLSLDDVQELLDLDAIAQLLQRPLPDDPEDLARWLVQEGITTTEGRGHYISNFGAMAAARKLDDFPSLARKRVRVVRYRGTNKVDTRRERSEQDIAIEKCGFYLKPQARYDYLLNLPEKENIANAIRAAMASIANP
jgi:predicted HTH transcriptional regulator